MNRQLPSGTVTFLLTDIEGSTRLWQEMPQAMSTAHARHDQILRTAIESNHGYIFHSVGDSFSASFHNALDGLSAALTAQRSLQTAAWGETGPIRVRMGLHTGAAQLSEDGNNQYDQGYTTIASTQRVMAAASGGQVLLTQTTRDLLLIDLPENTYLRDMGEHTLKDLQSPVHLYQVTTPDLQQDFPRIKSLNLHPNNLPVQLTSFIGREREVGEIKSLLKKARLVTLTGSGGTGKTRLAEEVSSQGLSNYPDGVWLIELAPLADESQIVPALGLVFGLREHGNLPLSTLVIDYLRDKNVLIILDNCEHLIAACARLADNLLHHCPGLTVLASSREALGIAGEMTYPIPSLADSESMLLFVERAVSANPKFILTDSNQSAVSQICRRLDGIPLAIELAAARVRLLTPEQIAARLDDRFRLLIGGSRTALPRQQTLRALIDWSYDLLSDDEKRLLRITSVFFGGWSLEALESIYGRYDTVDHLEQLVHKSLVRTDEFAHGMRYSLLETIRQYGRDKLMEAGERELVETRNRHLETFLNLAEQAELRLTGPEMIECLDELEMELDNLRAALEWAFEKDALAALRMAGSLGIFWGQRASATEGLKLVRAVMARAQASLSPDGEDDPAYLTAMAKALGSEMALSFELGDSISALEAARNAIRLARQVNANQSLAYALGFGSIILGFIGDTTTARAWADEALALCRLHSYSYLQSLYDNTKFFLTIISGQPLPPGFEEEIIQVARTSGNPWVLALALANLGRIMRYRGNFTEAILFLEESTGVFEQMRDKMMANSNQSEIGHVLRLQGKYNEASTVYHQTIKTFRELGQHAAVAHELECLAFIAIALQQYERAARLLGAAEALREELNSNMTGIERPEYEANVSKLGALLDESDFNNAWSEGRKMKIQEAIALAVSL